MLSDFRLVEVSVTDKTDWRFIALSDDAGHTGFGEFSYDGAPDFINAEMAKYLGRFIGGPADRSSMERHQTGLQHGLMSSTIMSAVEQALADLEARNAGSPLWRHLSGESPAAEVPLYANINRVTTDRSPSGFARTATRAIEHGFSRIKIAPFDGLSADKHDLRLVHAGLERISSVRSAIGTRDLMIDCHWRFEIRLIADILRDLAALNIYWLECPIEETETNLEEIAKLRRMANKQGIRLAGLETKAGWDGFRPYLEAEAYDVIMPDIKHCGGYSAFLQITEKAAQYGVAVSAHNPTGPVAHLGSVHATAAIGAPEPLEIQFDESPLFFSLLAPPPCIIAGSNRLPGGIGLGADLLISHQDG